MDITERLQTCHSSVVHDVMRERGLPVRVLPRSITGLDASMKAAGPVFTVRGRPDPTLDRDRSLDEWAGMLSRIPGGHVVVCQPKDDTRALFGSLSAQALAIKGVRGYIVDGGCRDVQAIVDQPFPVFARFATPIDIAGAWHAEAFDEPIAIGGLPVRPGDHVLADRDGIVLIGASELAEVVDAAQQKMSTEGELLRAIRAGEDPQAAYRRLRVF